jgi:hypothetical protein
MWFISGKNMLYPGRICAYDADKFLRIVTLSRLVLYITDYCLAGYNLLWFRVCSLRFRRLQITAILRTDKFIVLSFTYMILMLIFLYVGYYLEIIHMSIFYNILNIGVCDAWDLHNGCYQLYSSQLASSWHFLVSSRKVKQYL